jgi:hypothetical protein
MTSSQPEGNEYAVTRDKVDSRLIYTLVCLAALQLGEVMKVIFKMKIDDDLKIIKFHSSTVFVLLDVLASHWDNEFAHVRVTSKRFVFNFRGVLNSKAWVAFFRRAY